MLRSMRLRNLRGFNGDPEAPYVDIKPITVFVGKNSSGKSSFLRTLPLLRQSVEENTTGPILWYGSYVDFGAFSEALNNSSDTDRIYFDFNFEVHFSQYDVNFDFDSVERYEEPKIDIAVEVGVGERSRKTIAKSINFSLFGLTVNLEFESLDCELKLNGEVQKKLKNLRVHHFKGFLPDVGVVVEREVRGKRFKYFDEQHVYESYYGSIARFLHGFFHANKSLENVRAGVDKLGILSPDSVYDALIAEFGDNKPFLKNLETCKSLICNHVSEQLIIANVQLITKKISKEVESTFVGVRYIAPLRATAERYYRHQDLQVGEIDHTGSNLAVLLRSFSEGQNRQFENWTQDNFGFYVRVEEEGLHYELKIKLDDDDREYNISDMGFGFSQILPIVAAIWMESARIGARRRAIDRRNRTLIFAIEQPELHLHPEYQSRLSKMFAATINAAKKKSLDLRILFETHSKTMIDTLGDCVEGGLLDPDDINISMFQKAENGRNSEIKFSNFDKDGYLNEWPIGFFSGR